MQCTVPVLFLEKVGARVTLCWTALQPWGSAGRVLLWGSAVGVLPVFPQACKDREHLGRARASASGRRAGRCVCSLCGGVIYGLWCQAEETESYSTNANLTPKSVTCAVSLGTICAYHSSAKVSKGQLVKQTLPKYNFRAYNTEHLTFHYSVPPKPKVYFLHSALLFTDKEKKSKTLKTLKNLLQKEMNLIFWLNLHLISECTNCILYFMYVKMRNDILYIKTGKWIIHVINAF